MHPVRHFSVLLFLFLTAAAALGQDQPADLATIAQRMEQAARANRTHYRPYIVTREYRMFGSDEQQPKSEVTAEISFVPPKRKDFRITESNGSSRGENVVRHILESEAQATATGSAPGAITRANYDFRLLGEESLGGRDCFVLALLPKREDKSLLAGKAWIDKSTFLVRRVDGNLSKMPSWWLKSVHVTLDFDEVEGMWLQNHTRAVADVRMIGRHVLISDAVKFESGGIEARNLGANGMKSSSSNKARRSFSRSEIILGASVIHR